ncbi:MAG: type II/IV secretion system ATPase subunit [Dehalococcoidales bacterium]|nr:type II/IV secretion system ATPase subunit [Dehalococcoidales bacterium]
MLRLPFEIKPCPGECGKECGTATEKCPIFSKLSEELQEMCKENPHLLQYLRMLPEDKMDIPQYYEKVTRALKGTKDPNLIYNVGGGVFVHILANPEDIRDYYVAIEPSLIDAQDSTLDEIELKLADYVKELEGVADSVKRLEIIMNIVDRIVSVDGYKAPSPPQEVKNTDTEVKEEKGGKKVKGKKAKSPKVKGGSKGKIHVSRIQYISLRYLLRRKLEGMGLLDPMILDPNIEDISCSGLGNIFVEHKVFGGLRASIGFETNEALDKFVIELAEGIQHPVTFREPVVDATLPDGSRINIVYGMDVSKRGSNFTIRKFSDTPLSILELIQFGALSFDMAAYLSIILQEGMNVWVSGETASGKTTLLNALTTFIPPEAKIVSIEDTPEVQVPHHNWIRGCTRGSDKEGDSSEVSMFDLLKAALRQRPNLIIVGEIRGVEGAIAFQAMQTGHACMSTFHAASVSKLIQRVTGNPINVPKTYVDNLNVVVICQQVRLPNGSLARKLTSVNEIVSYDSIADSFSFIETFSWNPLDDTFLFRGFQNSYLLENKIAPRRGLPEEKRRQIYKVLKQRSDILKRMSEQGKTNFYDVYAILSKAYRDGYFR